MKYDPNANYTARVISIAEFFFFLFLDSKSYISRYYPLLDEIKPFGWGYDLSCYEQTGLRTVQVNNFIVKHHIQGETYTATGRNAHNDMLQYFAKRNHTVESLWNKKMVRSLLHMNHLCDSEWERILSHL